MAPHAAWDSDTLAARDCADRSAEKAGVRVLTAESLADVRAVREVIDGVFEPEPGGSEVSVELLWALAYTGQYVVLAQDQQAPDSLAIGACLGFFQGPHERALHSHAAAVRRPARGRHVGWSMKLHQRAWALEHGLTSITWTFDPLIRRNAWFNLAKLGVRPIDYKVDFYGSVSDAANAGDETDRFLVTWPLHDERVHAACSGTSLVAPPARELSAQGVPRLLEVGIGDGPVRPVAQPRVRSSGLVQIPPDIESVRRSDPGLAQRWRQDLREVLVSATELGLGVTGVGRDGWYVLGPLEAR